MVGKAMSSQCSAAVEHGAPLPAAVLGGGGLPRLSGARVLLSVSPGYARPDEVRRYVEALPRGTLLRAADLDAAATGLRRVANDGELTLEIVDTIARRKGEYRRSTPYERHVMLLSEADLLAAFWNGQADVTRQAMNVARDRGVPVALFLCVALPSAPGGTTAGVRGSAQCAAG